MATPLTDLLRGPPQKEPFKLTDAETKSFESLRDALVSPPVLALPKPGAEFVLDTDASERQIGCVLQQRMDSEAPLKPVGFFSRILNAAECNYSTTEKEALAIVWACRLLRPYLLGQLFVIRTDHDALKWLFT